MKAKFIRISWILSSIFMGFIFGYGIAYLKFSHNARVMQLMYLNQGMSESLETLDLLRNGDIGSAIELIEVTTLQPIIYASYALIKDEGIDSENIDENLLKDFMETYNKAQDYSKKYIFPDTKSAMKDN